MILFLDDDHEFVTAIRNSLSKLGINVLATSDPIEAIGMVRSLGISKVIADLQMPNMDGIEFLENVRQIDPNIKRILLTGDGGNLRIQKAMSDLVVDSVVHKPIDRPGLIEVIMKS